MKIQFKFFLIIFLGLSSVSLNSYAKNNLTAGQATQKAVKVIAANPALSGEQVAKIIASIIKSHAQQDPETAIEIIKTISKTLASKASIEKKRQTGKKTAEAAVDILEILPATEDAERITYALAQGLELDFNEFTKDVESLLRQDNKISPNEETPQEHQQHDHNHSHD